MLEIYTTEQPSINVMIVMIVMTRVITCLVLAGNLLCAVNVQFHKLNIGKLACQLVEKRCQHFTWATPPNHVSQSVSQSVNWSFIHASAIHASALFPVLKRQQPCLSSLTRHKNQQGPACSIEALDCPTAFQRVRLQTMPCDEKRVENLKYCNEK